MNTTLHHSHKSMWAIAAVAAALGLAGCAQPRMKPKTTPSIASNTVWLDTLDLSIVEQGWGEARAGRTIDDKPLTLAGRVFEHGVGTHAESEFEIDLAASAARFEALVGIDDETAGKGSAEFVAVVDGREAARSGILRAGDPPRPFAVDLAGAKRLTLLVTDAGDGIDYDHADWADARFLLVPGATARPTAYNPYPGPDPLIAPYVPNELAIHPPRIVGATPGRPFLFRIPATGDGRLNFEAENLPPGLLLDTNNGIISGALQRAGHTQVHVSVSDSTGCALAILTIVGGSDALALTPPMGWNSWNVWGTAVDAEKVRDAADWLLWSGLATRGYHNVNIDDAWEAERGDDGRIRSNAKFPDMKELADYVHSQGLKLGIYSSPGPLTCAGYEGSYSYEEEDVATYAEWGIDYLKYDWCSYGTLACDNSREEYRRPYEVMRAALDGIDRDIVYSLCQYGMGNVWEWGADVGGNLWRTTGDITDTWASLARIGFGQDGREAYAGPGRWNDPDMLVVGQVGWGPTLHPTRLTRHEQVTHMTLWSLLAAPLLIGCDLTQIDELTLALLGNPEVLEVNQDPLGRQGRRVWREGKQEVWSRPLADGTLAVGLFNRDRGQAEVHVEWGTLELAGPQQVRNLWQRKDEGVFETGYRAMIGGHGAVMLKVTPAGNQD